MYRCLNNFRVDRVDRKWMVASFNKFYGKCEKALLWRGFILRPIERPYVALKSDPTDFSNSPPFKRSAYFYLAVTRDFKSFKYVLKCFKYLNFETKFLRD